MPIIDFKPEDAMQAVTMEAGVYPCIITKMDAQQSSTQKSTNFFTDFQITGGKYQSKVVSAAFNTKTAASGMMGNMQFIPHSALLQVEAAQKNTKVEAKKQSLNTDDLLNKPFCIQIGVIPDATGGKLQNMILNFLPAGSEKHSVNGDDSIPF